MMRHRIKLKIFLPILVVLLLSTGSVSSNLPLPGTFIQHSLFSVSPLEVSGRLGSYLAMNDRFLAVGISPEPGTCPYAHKNLAIYEKTSLGWQPFSTLSADDLPQRRLFTGPIAMNDATIAVGARDMGFQRSVVIVYQWNGNTWLFDSEIVMPDLPEDCTFDGSIALDGDRMAIGMRTAVVDEIRYKGAVYIYTRVSSSWVVQQKLTYEGAYPYTNYFGYAVALQGDQLMVGVPYGGGYYRGEVNVYRYQDSLWSLVQTVMAADGGGDYFGYSLAVSGATLVVGAPLAYESYFEQGSAYIFEKIAGLWVQSKKLIVADGKQLDHFGEMVTIDGDTTAISAVNRNTVYIYRKPESGWNGETLKPQEISSANLGQFGKGLDIQGNYLAVGSPDEYAGEQDARGAVYLYFRGISFVVPETLIEGEPGEDLLIALDSQPAHPVSITFSPNEQLSLSQDTITFSESDWNQPQVVQVAALNSCYVNDDRMAWIVSQTISEDINYNQLKIKPLPIKILEKIRFQYSEFWLIDGKKVEIYFAMSQLTTDPVSLKVQANPYLSAQPELITIYPDGSRSEEFFTISLSRDIEQVTETTLLLESQSQDSFFAGNSNCLKFTIGPFRFNRVYFPVIQVGN